jgi:hypothetical protein
MAQPLFLHLLYDFYWLADLIQRFGAFFVTVLLQACEVTTLSNYAQVESCKPEMVTRLTRMLSGWFLACHHGCRVDTPFHACLLS